MIKGTDVIISNNGMITIMDYADMKYFLESISISTISLCKEIKFSLSKTESSLSSYDKLVNDYCYGNHLLLLNSNIGFLYNFVKGCVLNESVNGLGLLLEEPKKYKPVWQLVLTAIDEYIDLNKRRYALFGKQIPLEIVQYDAYNEEFAKMMIKFGEED